MIPTREQFKEYMAYVQNAQEKEYRVNDAFELIWDEEQAQHVPFYISPWWKVVRYAFCLLFNLKFNKLGIDDVLEWWLEEAPKGGGQNTGLTRKNTTSVTSTPSTTTW